jgi:Flp pilus assembly protein CpaB
MRWYLCAVALVLTSMVVASQPVYLSESEEPGPPLLLPPGTLGFDVKLHEKELAGFILPGKRVDVVVTTPRFKTEILTKVAVANVLVLGVRAVEGEAVTATIAVTPRQEKTLARGYPWHAAAYPPASCRARPVPGCAAFSKA